MILTDKQQEESPLQPHRMAEIMSEEVEAFNKTFTPPNKQPEGKEVKEIKDSNGELIGMATKEVMTREEAQRRYPDAKLPTEQPEAWEEALQVEVMEDYLHLAEMRHFAKDPVKHMEEMREYFDKLKSFIKVLLASQRESDVRR